MEETGRGREVVSGWRLRTVTISFYLLFWRVLGVPKDPRAPRGPINLKVCVLAVVV